VDLLELLFGFFILAFDSQSVKTFFYGQSAHL